MRVPPRARAPLTGQGYLRPEMKFPGVRALVRQIRADVGMSRKLLDTARMRHMRNGIMRQLLL